MIHLDPTSGLWRKCKNNPRCFLPYHAPVEEGQVSYSLLMETYASEELYREPDEFFNAAKIWRNANGDVHREHGLPAIIYPTKDLEWHYHGIYLGTYSPDGGLDWWYPNKIDCKKGAKLYVAAFT